MSATWVWCELVCRGCATTTSGRFIRNSRPPVQSMKNDARKQGWLFKDGEPFCSADCLDKTEQQEDELGN